MQSQFEDKLYLEDVGEFRRTHPGWRAKWEEPRGSELPTCLTNAGFHQCVPQRAPHSCLQAWAEKGWNKAPHGKDCLEC